MSKIKPDTRIVKKGRLHCIAGEGNRPRRFQPWLGDSFSCLYDFFMDKSVFPKKFGADIEKHYDTLSQQLAGVRGKEVLELGTGSGSAVHFLSNDNHYTGTDVSPGLLKRAAGRFSKAGFPDPEFYLVSADDLPFSNGIFEVCLCILSLNFIGNVEKVIKEVSRVLLPGGIFVCSVPVPERNRPGVTIRGILHSESELCEICRDHRLRFDPVPCDNGALVYFNAIKRD